LVLGISGGQAVVLGGPLVRDIPRGWQRGIYPLAIPLAANPAILACSLAFAANPDAGAGRTAVLGVAATLATVAVAMLVPARFGAAADAVARLTGGLAILVAAAMVVSGVRDV
jgi:small neutral amino acid transporter SnatA (MarC family)